MKVLKVIFAVTELVVAIVIGIKTLLMITTNMSSLEIFIVIDMLAVTFGLLVDVGAKAMKALTQH